MSSRQHMTYLDNLKLILAVSVIVFHTAVVYGPMGGWYYYERGDDLLVNIPLAALVVYLDAFFMSLFFFISGCVACAEYDRKGPRGFFYAKMKRLGLPLLVFLFTVSPVQEFIKIRFVDHRDWKFTVYYLKDVLTMRNLCPGQMWFVATLIVFSLVYMALRELFRNWNGTQTAPKDSDPLTLKRTLIFTLSLALCASALRQIFPAGKEFFHFIIGNNAQYIFFFSAGIIASRRGYLDKVAPGLVRFWNLSLIVLFPLAFIIMIGGGALEKGTDIFSTGTSWQFYAYTFWQMFFCTAMIVTLISVFKKHFNGKNIWSADSYAAYIIHPLTTIPYALALMNVELHPLLKFLTVAVSGVVTSFAVSRFVVRKLPIARDIL